MRGIRALLSAACSAFIVTSLVHGWTPAPQNTPGNPGGFENQSAQPTPGAAVNLPAAQSREDFLRSKPGVRYEQWEKSTRLFGNVFATGASAHNAAEQFRTQGAKAVFGAEAADLKPFGAKLPSGAVNQVPLMYNPQTGTYKFTAVYYAQHRGGLEVFNSRLVLLSRNVPSHDIVLASAELHDLGNFAVPMAALRNVNTGPAFAAAREDFNKNAQFFNARNVIFAGTDGVEQPPQIAVEFLASAANPVNNMPEEWLYVCDAQTGKILHKDNRILDVDVTGNVSGMATTGNAADVCNPEALRGMPYAQVSIGATTVFADVNGDFVIPNAGSSAVTVNSQIRGPFFIVNNQQAGGTTTQSANVTPPGPANFVYNAANTNEFQRAEVNAYIESNVVRDHCLAQNPAYPAIAGQTNFPVNVNINQNCNAFYSPSAQTINFYIAGGGCSNTANATVVHHEFGHHMVQVAGSGQGAYGEGMSDCQSLLIADSSCLGNGFNTCGTCLRTADNTLQYPYSGSGIHDAGRLISGCVWSTRNELLATHPATYLDILRPLIVNSILVHTGSGIDPSITVDVLTLDDTDGNILNGTPHYNQINAGFSAHNMDGPELDVGISVSPNVNLVSSGLSGGPFNPNSQAYTIQNVDTIPIDYQVTHSAAWVDVTNASGQIPVGGSVNVTVSINASANSLANGIYNDSVQFTNLTNGLGNKVRTVSLEIGRIVYPSTDTPKPLPDLATVTSNLAVTDSYCIGDVDLELNLTHTYIGDLTVEIKSPAGTIVRLHNRTGGSADNIIKTYNDGVVTPDGPGALADFVGEFVTGTWELKVQDLASADSGTLNNWALRIVPSGATCPPEASNVALSVPVSVISPVALSASSQTPGSLVYKVQSLAAHGSLFDPNGGPITTVPYTLASQGSVVNYKPALGYQGPDGFTYSANDGLESNVATVSITVGGPQVVHSFPMNSNPGWTTMGQWAFGVPTGGGSHNLDPTAGFTGANVYGYNLAGDYPNNLTPVQYLTSGAIDCTGVTGAQLKFQRWLGIESATYDHATVQVSNNGTTWTTVYNHTGSALNPTSWSLQTYDISTVADNQATVFVRWGMGTTDSSVTYPGWNIDDVQIWGLVPLCVADIAPPSGGDGQVDIDDLTAIILAWGTSDPVADIDGDGLVEIDDLTEVILAWGACP